MPFERIKPPFQFPPQPQPPPPPPPPPQTPWESFGPSFPIVTISIISILAIAILLLSYYAFVTNCCLNWQQLNTIAHLHWQLRTRHESLLMLRTDAAAACGLDELAIQRIPTFRYRRGQVQASSSNECVVCLNDFQEEERVRLLPNCFHVFHIDCIDAWLQTQANCPLCRSEITSTPPPLARISITELNPSQMESLLIDVRDDEAQTSGGNCNVDGEVRLEVNEGRKLPLVSSMGDECIERSKGREFGVQLMRRSFSMDSSNDRQLYIAVQEILQQSLHLQLASGGGGSEASSDTAGTSSRVLRSFFSFGHCSSSRNAVLPIQTVV